MSTLRPLTLKSTISSKLKVAVLTAVPLLLKALASLPRYLPLIEVYHVFKSSLEEFMNQL